MTLRQLFYQFVARGLIANTTAEYKRLSRTITDARRAGQSIGIILKTRRATSRPIRHGRARPISCAAPRKATSGIFGRTNGATPKSGSKKPPLSASSSRPAAAGASLTWRRGDTPSHSELYAAGKRLNRIVRGHQKPVIFYLGDHDPSGLEMDRSLRTEARSRSIFGLGLSPNPAKETDIRLEQYVAETGETDSWELDALSPDSIDALLEEAISGLVDIAEW